jgi:hypothetical protein
MRLAAGDWLLDTGYSMNGGVLEAQAGGWQAIKRGHISHKLKDESPI